MRSPLVERLVVAAGAAAAGATVALVIARRSRLPENGGSAELPAVDRLNARFHEHYDRARRDNTLRQPVLLVYADSLVLFTAERRQRVTFTPPLFHAIKAVTHAPLALFARLNDLPPGPLPAAARRALAAVAAHGRQARAALAGQPPDDPALAARLHALLAGALAFAEARLADGRHDPAALASFAATQGPAMLRCTHDATRVQLAALAAATDALLRPLGAAAERTLQVVVAGVHQARERSLAMQYFRRRLGEPDDAEHRVTYAEGIDDEAAALALVSTRRLDRELARAFFGDADRLQRDILGDAAHELLSDPAV